MVLTGHVVGRTEDSELGGCVRSWFLTQLTTNWVALDKTFDLFLSTP